jgi:hypothetical protein
VTHRRRPEAAIQRADAAQSETGPHNACSRHPARDLQRDRRAPLIERTPMMDRAPEATVEALMYSLRRGVEAITKPDNQRRLAELSEDQLLAVCQRLQNFKPNIASAWPPEEVEAIVSIWSTVHASR